MTAKGWSNRNNFFRYLVYWFTKPRLCLSEEDKEPYLVHLAKNPAFKDYIAREFDEDINRQLNKYGNMDELEYLLRFDKPCFVEPRYGWVISDGNIVFRRSLPYGITELTPLPHYIYYKRKKKVYLNEGLPLFYNWFNYWHFYNDIIGSLMVLDKLNFDKAVPLIVPQKALSVSYVKEFFTTEYSKKWKWLFVDEMTYVQLKTAYIVKSFANVKEQFLLAADIFKTNNRNTGNRKVFLDRNHAANGRYLMNKDEILPILKSYGFDICDTDGMSVWEQKALFESASVVLGIHGAGLTNMFFRHPNQCLIMELFPKGKYPIHYYWLARELGFEYDAISGENNEGGSFYLSKEKLSEMLQEHSF